MWCDHPTATYVLHMYSNIILFMHTFSLNIQTHIHNILSLADTLSTLPYKELIIYASMPRLTICIQFPLILFSLSSFLKIKLCTIPPKAPTVNRHLEVTEIASLGVGEVSLLSTQVAVYRVNSVSLPLGPVSCLTHKVIAVLLS